MNTLIRAVTQKTRRILKYNIKKQICIIDFAGVCEFLY